MKSSGLASLVAVAAMLAGCGGGTGDGNSATALNAPIEQVAAPNGGDWTQVVQKTDEGVRMGNPDAKVKLVEYASFGCPHCAEFSARGTQRLKDTYVKSGQVSWEFRPFLLFPTDPAVSALVQCLEPEASFRMIEQLYASQRDWYGRLAALPQDQLTALESMPPAERNMTLVQAAGLDAMFRQRGMPEARINSCLADQGALDRLVGITNRGANEEGITGTPMFIINGELAPNTSDWGTLEPKLRAAL